MLYTLGERIEMLLFYGKADNCSQQTAGTLNERHPDEVASHSYVLYLIARFTETIVLQI